MASNCDVKHGRTIIVACCVLHNFCRLHNDGTLVNPATDNTDDIANDNDVQPPIQTKRLLEALSQRARILI